MNPRTPTAEEKAQLVEFLLRDQDLEAYDADEGVDEERETLKGHVEDAYIAVFDDYISGSPGYTGKVMVVVWDTSPSETQTFAWHQGYLEQESPAA